MFQKVLLDQNQWLGFGFELNILNFYNSSPWDLVVLMKDTPFDEPFTEYNDEGRIINTEEGIIIPQGSGARMVPAAKFTVGGGRFLWARALTQKPTYMTIELPQ